MIEVELKFATVHDKLIQILKKKAVYMGSEENIDQYYLHPCRDFIASDEGLRVRMIGESYELTYKGPKIGDKAKSRVEFNSITDENISDILINLGFQASGVVTKQRTKYKMGEVLITLDNVEGLGEFVEMEMVVHDENKLETTVNYLRDLAISFDIDPETQILDSYLNLLQAKSNM